MQQSLRWDMRENFLTASVVKHWTWLFGEIMESPSWETFGSRQDKLLSKISKVADTNPVWGGIKSRSFQPLFS